MSVVHEHGRGMRLGTCPVNVVCVVVFVAYINGAKFSVMYLTLLHRFCMGMDKARTLVHA